MEKILEQAGWIVLVGLMSAIAALGAMSVYFLSAGVWYLWLQPLMQ